MTARRPAQRFEAAVRHRGQAARIATRKRLGEVAASYAECNRIARAARSSFYLAFYRLA